MGFKTETTYEIESKHMIYAGKLSSHTIDSRPFKADLAKVWALALQDL